VPSRLVILYFAAKFIAAVPPFDLACAPLRMQTFWLYVCRFPARLYLCCLANAAAGGWPAAARGEAPAQEAPANK